jgi:precorrin-6Y C5,15-methyltransferase (decarboxylating)
MARLFVIGIGYRPLDSKARDAVLKSEALLASPRLADVFERYREFDECRERLIVNDSIEETFSVIRKLLDQGAAAVTLLASGDPLFYGIARRVLAGFGRDEVMILPDLSCIQVAFSRLGMTWDDALLISLHGGPDPGRRRRLEHDIDELSSLVSVHPKIAILTDAVNNPAVIAEVLAAASQAQVLRVFVCERLCYPDERIVAGGPHEIAAGTFREPNVVVILSDSGERVPE